MCGNMYGWRATAGSTRDRNENRDVKDHKAASVKGPDGGSTANTGDRLDMSRKQDEWQSGRGRRGGMFVR